MGFIGHRGASARAPENTRASFELAFRAGAGAECDIQCAADGLVVLHDTTLRRLAPACSPELIDTPVLRLRVSELESVDIGSWYHPRFAGERVLTLEGFLALVPPSRRVFIELKGTACAAVSEVIATVRASGVEHSMVTFISFDFQCVQTLKHLAPEFRAYHIVNVKAPWPFAEMSALRLVDKAVAAGLDGVNFRADAGVVTERVAARLHKNGLDCCVWANKAPARNDGPEMWQAMSEAGVDYFTSNLPDGVFEWRDAHQAEFEKERGDTA